MGGHLGAIESFVQPEGFSPLVFFTNRLLSGNFENGGLYENKGGKPKKLN